MECVYVGTYNASGKGWCGGSGAGPWVMADLESGIWACDQRPGVNAKSLPMPYPFVTGMVKGFGDVPPNGRWAIKAGNAAAGALATQFDGPRPVQDPKRAPYYPMRLTGSIVLGIGGDNSDGGACAVLRERRRCVSRGGAQPSPCPSPKHAYARRTPPPPPPPAHTHCLTIRFGLFL